MYFTKEQLSEVLCKYAERENGLQYLLENVIADVFPKTPLQRCTTHLKHAIISDVRMGDKRDAAEELKQVFRTGDRNHTVEKAWSEWQTFCDKRGRYYRSFKRRRDDCS